LSICINVDYSSPVTEDELLDAVGPAFSRLRRSVLLDVPDPVTPKDLSRTPVLGLVAHGGEVTVGCVAHHLGIDPSVASRMVADCIAAGYLTRAVSQQDARRAVLLLTQAGTEMLASFRRQQRAAYEQITARWSEHDRLELARLLIKYVGDLPPRTG
jgi:DNA-binding MarR family transcriptional regulator